ncbi:MAG TPA: alpha/beta hydrolase [Amnibacterium sp.]|nr:alpha/beta hydrolase [Amnibacterium sp.]
MRVLYAAVLAAVLLSVSACTSPAPRPTPSASPDGAITLQFAAPGGTPLRLDACVPAGGSALPILVLVHGGQFTAGSRTMLRQACLDGAAHGYASFSVDYRLVKYKSGTAPVRFPGQLEDVASAVSWLRADAQVQRFRTDRSRVVLLGESAGAVLAGELAVGVPDSPLPASTFSGAVLLSGAYDFAASDLGAPLRGIEDQYLGCGTTSPCAAVARASTINHVKRGDPPMLVINSEHELVPRSQADRFAAALQAKGVSHRLVIGPGNFHGIDIAAHSTAITADIWSFVASVVHR